MLWMFHLSYICVLWAVSPDLVLIAWLLHIQKSGKLDMNNMVLYKGKVRVFLGATSTSTSNIFSRRFSSAAMFPIYGICNSISSPLFREMKDTENAFSHILEKWVLWMSLNTMNLMLMLLLDTKYFWRNMQLNQAPKENKGFSLMTAFQLRNRNLTTWSFYGKTPNDLLSGQ